MQEYSTYCSCAKIHEFNFSKGNHIELKRTCSPDPIAISGLVGECLLSAIVKRIALLIPKSSVCVGLQIGRSRSSGASQISRRRGSGRRAHMAPRLPRMVPLVLGDSSRWEWRTFVIDDPAAPIMRQQLALEAAPLICQGSPKAGSTMK